MTLKKSKKIVAIILLTLINTIIIAKPTISPTEELQNTLSKNDSLLLQDSKLLSKNYQFDAAIGILEKIMQRDSLNQKIIIALESLYHKTAQYNSAIWLDNVLIHHKVDTGYYSIRKAICFQKIGKYQKSLQLFKQAYLRDTTNSFMTTKIGDLYKSLQKPDSAIIFYDKTCQIKPSSSVIIRAMDLLLKAKQNEEALQFFRDYYNKEFANNNLLSRLYGKTLYVNDKIGMAKKTFSALYESGDSSLVTTKYLGMCMWKLEGYQEGITIFEEHIKNDSLDFQVYYMLGSCHVNNKFELIANRGKGEKYLTKALKLLTPDPKTLNLIYNDLATYYQRERNYEKELAIYKIMKKNAPKSRYVDYKMATLYDYGFKDKKEALQRYKNLLALYDTNDKKKKSDIEKFCENRIELLTEEQFWNDSEKE